MKVTQAFVVWLCLLGATQLAWSQVKEPAAHAIPGYLDPKTGKFTTQITPGATAQPDAQAAATSTSVFFREQFNIAIANYDQSSGSTVVCSVEMSSYGDAAGDYEESASVTATATGNGFSCDVPVLTLWTLQTPTTDTISASITVSLYSGSSPSLASLTSRSSTRSLTLTQPGNTQTVINTINISL